MALYLVQHGKNLSKDQDPDKGLSDEGKETTRRMATVANGYQVSVAQILHSGKKRSRETAEIIAEVLRPEQGMSATDGLNPMDDVPAFKNHLDLARNVMLVGHLPFLERLIGLLVCGDPDRTVFKLQNSGILCIDRVLDIDHAVIRWALMPTVG